MISATISKDVTGNEVVVIRTPDGITIAAGYRCDFCKVIRPFDRLKCNCSAAQA